MSNLTFLMLLVAFNFHVLHAQSGHVGSYGFGNCNANDHPGLGNHGNLNGNPSGVAGQREDGLLFNQNLGYNSRIDTDSLTMAALKMPPCSSICAGSLGENILPDGDFGSGVPNILPTNPGLAPGYTYQPNPPPNDGFYCITNNTAPWGWFATTFWIDIEDNGPEPNGYMMVVNATYQPGLFYQRTVDVCENTPYEFSIDVVSLIFSAYPNMIRPNISFLIDGIAVCETGDIAPDEQWHTSRFSFMTAPGQTTATLALRNNAPGGGGNDLAIDNISFRTCGPLVTVPSEVNFCNGMPATIRAVLASSPYNNTVYQWQSLINGVWEDVPNANSDNLEVLNPVDGSMFRLLVASALPNLSRPNCRIVSETVQLKRLPDPIVSTTAQDVSCAGGSNGSASATTATGAAPYQYAWESGVATPSVANLNAGTYWVTVTDAMGCAGVGSVAISEPPLLTTSIAATNIPCFGGTGGNAVAAANGGVSPYSYVWSNGEANASIANLMAGDYQVTVTDANACTVAASVALTEPPLLIASATATDVSCFGMNDAAATVSVSGGFAPFSYAWSSGETSNSLSDLEAGNYQVTVTDMNACTIVATATVAEPPPLATSTASTNVACYGGTEGMAIASVTGGVSPYAFVWSNGQTNAAVSNLSAGMYAYSATDANGCMVSETVSIAQPPQLSVSTSTVESSCHGSALGLANATASGGVGPYGFLWSNGETNATIVNLFAGDYLVTVTDANTCTVSAAVVLTESPLLVANATATEVSCFGMNDATATVSVVGGLAPFSYAWSNGETGNSLADLEAGTYQVVVTDMNACTTVTTATVAEPSPLTASTASTNIACHGGTEGTAIASVAGGVSPYSFEWSNGETSNSLADLAVGTYSVVVTDMNACTTVATATVTEPPPLTASTASTNIACYGGTEGMAIASVSGGVSPYAFIWSNGETNAAVGNLSAGLYAYSATDANGCMVTDTVSIAQPPQLSVNASAVEVSCHSGADGLANATAAGGVGPYGFIWSNGQTGALNQNLAASTYAVTLTDQNGCSSVDSVTVIQPSLLQLNLNTISVSCNGGADGVITANLNGGTNPYTYQWSNGVFGPTNSNLTAGTYSLTATDANGCTLTAQEVVVQPTALTSDVNAEDVACNGASTGEASVVVTGGTFPYSFLWNIGANTPQITNLPMGSYSVSITDAHGCLLTATAQVNEPPPLLLQTDKTAISCVGDADGALSAMASGGTPPYVFQWNNEQTTAEIEGLAAGIYALNVTDAKGCSTSTSESLAEPPPLWVHLGLDLALQLGDVVDLTASVSIPPSEVMDYTWSGSGGSLQCTDCNTYRFQPTASGCQQVLVRSKKGCIAADTICYEIRSGRRVYAPNGFSPNGDGINDFFTLFSDDGVKQLQSLMIFNRWGEHVYQTYNIKTNDEPRGWDGTFRGQEMDPAVFVWVALVEFIDGEVIQMSGDVTLVR
jgi:gliding motility-associated-like protein